MAGGSRLRHHVAKPYDRQHTSSASALPSARMPRAPRKEHRANDTKTVSLHDASIAKEANFDAIAKMAKRDPASLNARAATGHTPLTAALHEGFYQNAAQLLYLGAKPLAAGPDGLMPVYWARGPEAAPGQTALWAAMTPPSAGPGMYGSGLAHPDVGPALAGVVIDADLTVAPMALDEEAGFAAMAMHDSALREVWPAPDAVRMAVGALKPGHPEQIDAMVKTLTAAGDAGDKGFGSCYALQKYWSHLNSFERGPFGVEGAGWEPYEFLPERVRSLIAYVVEDKTLVGGDRDVVLREIDTVLQSLRIARAVHAILQVRRSGHEAEGTRLIGLEAARLLACANGLQPNQEIAMPVGWQDGLNVVTGETDSHAIYANMQRQQVPGIGDVLTLRIDNLGECSDTYHAGAGRRQEKTYPLILNMPLAADGTLADHFDQVVLLRWLRTILRIASNTPDPTEARRGESVDGKRFYESWSRLQGALLAHHGPDVVFARTDGDYPAQFTQAAGNCVVESHQAGAAWRLGDDLFARFRAFELASVEKRMLDLVDPRRLKALHVEESRRVAKERAG